MSELRREAISTEGRIFTAQFTRELAARQVAGAQLLSPGTRRWEDAFAAFFRAVRKTTSPIKATKIFRAGIDRLFVAQRQHRACFVNCFMRRSRSAYVEVLTYEVSSHPLVQSSNEGIAVNAYMCQLQRRGRVGLGFARLAFISWHALGRMHERGDGVDIFFVSGVVACCGVAGLLMRPSDRHLDTEINLAFADILCTGVLRHARTDAGVAYSFFDVLTVLPVPEQRTPKLKQGAAITDAVFSYLKSDDANWKGYADKIPVLPFHDSDFVSRELRAGEQETLLRGEAAR